MLTSGYLGETKQVERNLSLFIGFVFFFMLYGFIYYKFLYKKEIFDNQILYWAFLYYRWKVAFCLHF